MNCFFNAFRKAFTLVEMLITIAVIGILIALILPAVHLIRDQAEMAKCSSQLKNIGTLFHLYAGDHDGLSPPMATTAIAGSARTWRFHLAEMYTGPLQAMSYTQRIARLRQGDYPFWCPTYVRNFGKHTHVQCFGSYSLNGYFNTQRKIQGLLSSGMGRQEPLISEGAPSNPSNTQNGARRIFTNFQPGDPNGTGTYHRDQRINALYLAGHVRTLNSEEQDAIRSDMQDISDFQ